MEEKLEEIIEEYSGARYLVDEQNRFLYRDDTDMVSKYITVEPLEEKVDTYIIWDKEKEEWYYEPYPDAWAGCAIPVPQTITPRQARLILLRNGLLDDVEEAVKVNREFEIYWEYGLEVNRHDSVLIQMAESLGISGEMLDEMFVEGSKL